MRLSKTTLRFFTIADWEKEEQYLRERTNTFDCLKTVVGNMFKILQDIHIFGNRFIRWRVKMKISFAMMPHVWKWFDALFEVECCRWSWYSCCLSCLRRFGMFIRLMVMYWLHLYYGVWWETITILSLKFWDLSKRCRWVI